MLYIYLPVLSYHVNLYVTAGAYAGGRGFLLSQRSFVLSTGINVPFSKGLEQHRSDGVQIQVTQHFQSSEMIAS